MTNPPQSVTERYVSNLLSRGDNGHFIWTELTHHDSVHEGIIVGHYFKVIVTSPQATPQQPFNEFGVGATPASALRRALEKFGVTFR